MPNYPDIIHKNVKHFGIYNNNILIKTNQGTQISYSNASNFFVDIREPRK